MLTEILAAFGIVIGIGLAALAWLAVTAARAEVEEDQRKHDDGERE